MIGLVGAHRTGKTTLARKSEETLKTKFIQTSASKVFRDMGYDPAVTYPFSTRLVIQREILKVMEEQWASHAGEFSITDRSPIDMLAYTMAEATGMLDPELEPILKKYTDDCFAATNKYFSALVLIQPGIPLVYEEGKAANSPGYIEHLNSLMMGLVSDERLSIPHFYLPRSRTDLTERVGSVKFAIKRVYQGAIDERLTFQSHELH